LDSLKGLFLMPMNQSPTVKSGRRRRVSTEQKLAILQPWQAGALELVEPGALSPSSPNRRNCLPARLNKA
jgi:hypothetical protein